MLSFSAAKGTDYSFIRSLYETAFPIYERRSWEQLEEMMLLPNMHVVVAMQATIQVSFAIYWQIEGWYFLEHIAVDPLHGGKGYGSQMMLWLLQQSTQKLLLEVELPTDETSRRRIQFYQKLGFAIAPFPYQQPPYRRGETTPAMHILSVPAITDTFLFDYLTTSVQQQVFEAFY